MSNELYHHGIKGQRWGVRRYQNEDGTYTSEGLKRRNEGGIRGNYEQKKNIATLGTLAYRNDRLAAKQARLAKKSLKKSLKAKTDEEHDMHDRKFDEHLKNADKFNKASAKVRKEQIALRKENADRRVQARGKNGAVAAELGKAYVRSVAIGTAANAITLGATLAAGPVGGLVAGLATYPLAAIQLQSTYVANRNISDIKDSDKMREYDYQKIRNKY